MDLQLNDKVIFVAGGSRGIGLGIVEACLNEGARLAITARGADALGAVHRRLAGAFGEDRIWSMAGDMRDTVTIEKALDSVEREFGMIWGAVANVGLHPTPPGYDVDDATWGGAFAQNLDSAFRLARGTLKRMTPRKEGSFVFISSIAGLGAMSGSQAAGQSQGYSQPPAGPGTSGLTSGMSH